MSKTKRFKGNDGEQAMMTEYTFDHPEDPPIRAIVTYANGETLESETPMDAMTWYESDNFHNEAIDGGNQ